MSPWIESSIPFVTVFVMLIVGTDLRLADFQRVRRYPVLVPGIVCAQWVLLIGIAGLVGRLLDLPPGMTGGAILLAAAPVAAMSGFYTQLAGGHLALAVTVAAMSNLLAPIVTPVAASLGFWLFLDSDKAMELPMLKVALQAIVGLLLPLLAGMLLRHGMPNWVTRWRGVLQDGLPSDCRPVPPRTGTGCSGDSRRATSLLPPSRQLRFWERRSS